MKVGCVLMASGFSRRYGADKLLERVEGTPLYLRALNALGGGIFDELAVAARAPEILSAARSRGCLALENPGAEEGLSSSIRLGVAALGHCDALAFAVCDQPWLRRESVARLAAAARAQPGFIWAMGSGGQRGNPVIFPARLFPQLAALSGESGGSAVIARHSRLLRLVEAGSPAELKDLDYPTDLGGGRLDP